MSMLSFDDELLKWKYGDAEVVILMIFVVLKSDATNLAHNTLIFKLVAN